MRTHHFPWRWLAIGLALLALRAGQVVATSTST